MFIYQIIHQVHEAFKGLPDKLAEKTRKNRVWWYSHGYEPRTLNPIANGNPSPVDHYVEYVELYEATAPGSGQTVNEKVYAELKLRLNNFDCYANPFDCLSRKLRLDGEISAELANALQDGKLDRAEIREMRRRIPELIESAERMNTMLDFHEGLLDAVPVKQNGFQANGRQA